MKLRKKTKWRNFQQFLPAVLSSKMFLKVGTAKLDPQSWYSNPGPELLLERPMPLTNTEFATLNVNSASGAPLYGRLVGEDQLVNMSTVANISAPYPKPQYQNTLMNEHGPLLAMPMQPNTTMITSMGKSHMLPPVMIFHDSGSGSDGEHLISMTAVSGGAVATAQVKTLL